MDHIPFLVCLVTPTENHVFLANTTLLRKISHTSQKLRVDNIKGSFNGSDIIRELEGITNEPANIQRLFDIHREIGFEGNLPRLPAFKTDNTLGDYQRIFDEYFTETDVKTKIMVLSSNPKAYNLDKVLQFLATEKSVFMFYFVGVDLTKIVNSVLVSMFQTDLLASTILLKHWSGRNSRGVSQFEGRTIEALIKNPKTDVNTAGAMEFLKKLIAL